MLLAFSQLTKPIDHLYRELQFALREAVGTRTLDELLEDKQVIDDVVSEQVKSRMLPFRYGDCLIRGERYRPAW